MKLGQHITALFQKLGYGLSVFMLLFFGMMFVMDVVELVTRTNKEPISTGLGLLVFLGGMIFMLARNVFRHVGDQNAVRELKEEQSILNRARQSGAPLTITETALDCQLRIADTKKAFERLALTGVCRIDVTEEGELCYKFPSFSSGARKVKASEYEPETLETIEKELHELS